MNKSEFINIIQKNLPIIKINKSNIEFVDHYGDYFHILFQKEDCYYIDKNLIKYFVPFKSDIVEITNEKVDYTDVIKLFELCIKILDKESDDGEHFDSSKFNEIKPTLNNSNVIELIVNLALEYEKTHHVSWWSILDELPTVPWWKKFGSKRYSSRTKVTLGSKMNKIEYEYEYDVYAIHDNTKDFYLRLTKLVPEYNTVQLRKMIKTINGVNCVPLGAITNTINIVEFKKKCKKLNISCNYISEKKPNN